MFQDDSIGGPGWEYQEDARQRLEHLQADRDVAFATSNTQMRGDELKKIERDLSDISDIVRDVGVMVQAQGEQLGEGNRGVAANLAHARTSAHKAAVETAKAGKARAKRRSVEGTCRLGGQTFVRTCSCCLPCAQKVMRRSECPTSGQVHGR